MGHLTAAERNGEFHLVVLLEELPSVSDLERVVVFFDLGPELDLLEMRDMLLLPGLLLLLALFVLVLPEVHHPADGRARGGRDLDEVEQPLLRVCERFADTQDAYLFPVRPDHADLRDADAIVHTDFFGCGDSVFLLSNRG